LLLKESSLEKRTSIPLLNLNLALNTAAWVNFSVASEPLDIGNDLQGSGFYHIHALAVGIFPEEA
jgi:hypothetical protein